MNEKNQTLRRARVGGIKERLIKGTARVLYTRQTDNAARTSFSQPVESSRFYSGRNPLSNQNLVKCIPTTSASSSLPCRKSSYLYTRIKRARARGGKKVKSPQPIPKLVFVRVCDVFLDFLRHVREGE